MSIKPSDRMLERLRERKAEREAIRSECEADFCPTWVPQKARDEVWRLAWEHGHSSGAHEVQMHYDEFMDIVRAMKPQPGETA